MITVIVFDEIHRFDGLAGEAIDWFVSLVNFVTSFCCLGGEANSFQLNWYLIEAWTVKCLVLVFEQQQRRALRRRSITMKQFSNKYVSRTAVERDFISFLLAICQLCSANIVFMQVESSLLSSFAHEHVKRQKHKENNEEAVPDAKWILVPPSRG